MSLMNDIINEQTKQGNLGGKNGTLSKKSSSSDNNVNFFIITGEITDSSFDNSVDPFVRIGTIDNKDKIKWFLKTSVRNNTKKPSWSYEINHDIDLDQIKKLAIEMHHKTLLSSKPIGDATIDISNIENQSMIYETIQIFDPKDKSKSVGSVYLSIEIK
ncbi:hypothetical protein ACTFIY_011760 [Dictyostelium cf. discoideum]